MKRRIWTLLLLLALVVSVSAAGTYIGSVNSNVYHKPTCGQAARIRDENIIEFSSADDAVAHGYRPCSYCKPPQGKAPAPETEPVQKLEPSGSSALSASASRSHASEPETGGNGIAIVVAGIAALLITAIVYRIRYKTAAIELDRAMEDLRAEKDKNLALSVILQQKQKELENLKAVADLGDQSSFIDSEHPYGAQTVYVAYRGNRYHRHLNCPGLPNGGKPVDVNEVPAWVKPCGYCARGVDGC